MKKKNSVFVIICAAVMLLGFISAMLIYNGYIRLNNPSMSAYPVRGVDISSYQGTVDWAMLESQGISFAFIKATEGSGMVDKNFAQNHAAAKKTSIRIGAYHFFSYDSSGITQAENFISTVPKTEGMLPPVVDLEFYGDYSQSPALRDYTRTILDDLLRELEQYFGLKPIIYVTAKSYNLYINGSYDEYDIWIRNVYFSPYLSDGRDWVFWQYSDKGKLDGYSGEEEHIDLNVFNGNASDFANYAK